MTEVVKVALITGSCSIIATAIPTIITLAVSHFRNKENLVFRDSMKRGMQKSLKHDLIDIYEKCKKAYDEKEELVNKQDLDDFLDIYEVYHSLGANGKMDSRKDWMIAHQEEIEIGDHGE